MIITSRRFVGCDNLEEVIVNLLAVVENFFADFDGKASRSI